MARMSGTALTNFFKLAERMGKPVGDAVRGVGKEMAEQGIVQAGKNVLGGQVKGLTAAQLASTPLIPAVGRNLGGAAATKQAISLAGNVAQIGAPSLVAASLGGLFDQQNVGSQPFRGRKTGDSEFDSFLHQQSLEQQRLENEMAVVRQKAVLSVPTPVEMAQAERYITEAGEATNREILGVARSIYGTGLRA